MGFWKKLFRRSQQQEPERVAASLDVKELEAVVKGNAVFALALYGELKEAEGNLFFSPYSISTALAMTYAGARGNTERQMARTLHFTLGQERLHPAFCSLEAGLNAVQEKGHIQLSAANALWPQKGYAFLEEFLVLTEKYYGVLITPVDYREATEAARRKINVWVEEKTENKIKDLIPPGILDDLTRLVLVNAIYFKGNWASQFQKTLTKEAPFWVTPTKKIKVPMMTQQQKFRYAESDSLQILELPYVGNDLSMVVLLPRKVDGLAELEDALTVESLEKWTRGLNEREVQVLLPRFKMDSQFGLNKTLASMGMIDAFDQDKADFSGMDGRKQWLYISAVIHKAFVDVNEEGTEAAAATAVVMGARGLGVPKPPLIFRADHPFVFLIRDNHTGSILFLGRVVNPMSGAA
ncbi:MAG: serpin family protein [Bacteroidota bacterium]